jgi:hypothetical protein
MTLPSFDKLAGTSAILVAVAGFAYSVTFSLYVKKGYDWAFTASVTELAVGGLLTFVVIVALYQRLRIVDASYALMALLLGGLGAAGALVHGSYDLSVKIKQLGVALGANPVDPRGVLVFAVSGLALGVVGLLILSGGAFPKALGRLAVAGSVLLLVVYFGRLTVFDPNNAVLAGAALIAGVIVLPAFYVGVGLELRSGAGADE